ncbi:MAG: hypothetical protein MJ091_06425 [Clostridia bacterium]|nr:hypothetical protein [Clostridia bacterium]
MKNRISSKTRKLLAYYIIVVIMVLALASIGVVSARYIYQNGTQGTIQSQEFYFSSNLLDGQTHTLAPGSAQISFSLGNHDDDLRYSQVAINYTVKVNGAAATGTNVTDSLAAGSIQNKKVTVSGLNPGQSYTITAEGVGGYHKTLSATIVIPQPDASLYKYLDTSNPGYVLLTVWAKGVQGNVTITPPNTVIPDNTDAVMRSATTGVAFIDSTSFASSGYASHVYGFFGSGVTAENFTVTCGSIAAEIKAPN